MRRLISVAVVTAAVMGLMVLWVTMPAGAHDHLGRPPPQCPDGQSSHPAHDPNPTHCFNGAKWVHISEIGIDDATITAIKKQRHTYSQKHLRRGTSVAPSANSLQAPHGFHADAEHWLDYEFRCIRSQTDGTTPGTTPGTTTRPENC